MDSAIFAFCSTSSTVMPSACSFLMMAKISFTSFGVAGVAFAFNERTSFSMSFSNRLSARARTRVDGQPWLKVIGSDANAAMFNLGVTYAMSQNATVVGLLGIGLTPDAPDFTLGFKIPYSL